MIKRIVSNFFRPKHPSPELLSAVKADFEEINKLKNAGGYNNLLTALARLTEMHVKYSFGNPVFQYYRGEIAEMLHQTPEYQQLFNSKEASTDTYRKQAG